MEHPYSPGLEGIPAAQSSIAHIDGEKGMLYYRGYPVEDLAGKSSFEETSYLLLYGDLPSKESLTRHALRLAEARSVPPTILDMLYDLPKKTHPMHALATALCAMTPFAGDATILTEPATSETRQTFIDQNTIHLIAVFPSLVASWARIRKNLSPLAPRTDLGHAANFLWMLTEKEPDETVAHLMDVCLVLHAEHTFNASTFTVRVASSSLPHPWPVMTTGVVSLSGPLHGGANEEVLKMLEHIGTTEKAASFLEEQLAQKRKIWGMGHREYRTKDPRAKIMEKLVHDYARKKGGAVDPLFQVALALEEAAQDKLGPKGVWPNVDFYSGIVYREMGIETDLFTPIFAIARIAGWCAHWKEQMASNRIYRPTQVYTGQAPRHYAPLDARA